MTPRRLFTIGRALFRSPGYAIPAVLTLGLGIGSIASVYALARGALLRPVPGVAAPDDLVTIQLESTESVTSFRISHPDLLDVERGLSSVGATTAYSPQDLHLATGGEGGAARIHGEVVTADYFTTLGVRLAAGPGFATPGAEPAAGGRAVVLGHELWVRRWGESSDAVGATVTLNGEPFTVVGVAPEGFRGTELPGRAELWVDAEGLPALLHEPDILTDRGREFWRVLVARPTPGTSTARIEAELARVVESIRNRSGAHSFLALPLVFRAHEGIGVPPLDRGHVRSMLALLLAAAGLLFLLTCANVANLGLVRHLRLRASTAVRAAMGASPARLGWERLVEHAAVGVAGAAVAGCVAFLALGLVPRLGSDALGLDVRALEIDARIALVTVAVGLFAGLLSGLVPTLQVGRGEGTRLPGSGRHLDRRSKRIRGALVVLQVGLSTVLVVGAGLLVQTVRRLEHVDVGFDPAGMVAFSLEPGLQGYDAERARALMARLVADLERTPGIERAAIAHFPPFSTSYIPAVLRRPGTTDEDAPFVARSFAVTPSFFDMFGLGPRAGDATGFASTPSDAEAPPVAIVNEAAAGELFPDAAIGSVVGRTVTPRGGRTPPIRIVGVAADARLATLRRPAEPQVFRPWSQSWYVGQLTAYVRGRGTPESVVAGIHAVVAGLDPSLPVYGVRTVEDEIAGLMTNERFLARSAGALGAVAAVLAALGLYALLAYLVVERWREIGIRSALGALPRQLVGLVMRTGVGLTVAGLALGLLGAAWLGELIESRLFGVASVEPAVYAAGAGLLLAIACLASFLPARRALRMDVTAVLRSE